METIYALIESGIVVNCIVADEWAGGVNITHLDPRPGIGWSYDGEAFTAPLQPDPEPVPAEPRHITNFALDMRFTDDERVDIELASIDNPTAPIGLRRLAAAIRVAKERSLKAGFTDLDLPATRNGVLMLESHSLIAPGRALMILDAPIEPHERP